MARFDVYAYDSKTVPLVVDVQADLGFARLTSSTAFSDVSVFSISDSSGFLRTHIPQYYFGNPRVHSPLDRRHSVETFTQELRLVSEGESVDWVAGVFYLQSAGLRLRIRRISRAVRSELL